MIFVDSNVPMYLVGADHPHKSDARRLVEGFVSERRRLVTDAEAFQEILHRYVAIRRRDAIQPAFDALRGVVDEVFTVTEEDVLGAKSLVTAYERLSARDALHVAVMARHQISEIMSFDTGFDIVSGVRRVF